jgi:hypothetical protein
VNKRQGTILICSIALIVGAISLWMPTPSAAPSQKSSPAPRSLAPTHVVYSALFHHVVDVMREADEMQRQGKDTSPLRSFFQRKANLNEFQARILDTVADDCVRQLDVQDARAQLIINEFRKRFPPGKLPPGVKLPPPPPELTQMQEERDAMILRARDRLRVALGDDEFQRFEGFVTERVASGIMPVVLQRSAPAPSSATQQNQCCAVTTAEGGK